MKEKNESTKVMNVNVNDIIPNTDNPRIILDSKFKKLLQSIQDFPEMLQLRPIIINQDMVILGGNMRYKAAVHLGYTELPVIYATGFTKEQEAEFIIKDNVNFGEWDMDLLANQWETNQLKEWGIDLPSFDVSDLEKENNESLDNYVIKYEIVFNNEGEQESWYKFMKDLKDKYIECDTFSERLIKFLEENKYV